MKYFIPIAITIMLLPGCKLKDAATELATDIGQSYNNVVTEINDLVKGFTETKKEIEETIENVETAIDEAGQAIDAVKGITGNEEETTEKDA